jgi:Protein of unknown function (DUF1207)
MRKLARLLAVLFLVLLLPTSAAALPGEDAYVEGYATALLEREFRITAPSLRVQNGVIIIGAADLAGADRARVVSALSRIRGAVRVDVVEPGAVAPPLPTQPDTAQTEKPKVLEVVDTGWFPGGTLFEQLIADPRWPHFGASYQYYLEGRGLEHVGAVSFGETITAFRTRLGPVWWEAGVQAGVFALFDLAAESKDLINADYFVGLFNSVKHGNFSMMGRLFHQSSHLGDEFLLRDTQTNRVNLSYEQVDLKLSYHFLDMFRIYAGGGYLFDQEPANLDPWSIQYGLEFRSPWPGPTSRVHLRPIAAVDIQNRQENSWHADVSARAGLQFEGVIPGRYFQIMLEYFRGHSPNGQFYRDKVEYLGLGTHFHF